MMIFAVFALVLLLVAASLIAGPFVAPPTRDEPGSEGPEDAEQAALIDERRRLLDAIRELDVDLASGKLSAADHGELRGLYALKAAATMERLEQLQEEAAARAEATTAAADEQRSEVVWQLEEQIAARKAALGSRSCTHCGEPVAVDADTHSCREPVVPQKEAWNG